MDKLYMKYFREMLSIDQLDKLYIHHQHKNTFQRDSSYMLIPKYFQLQNFDQPDSFHSFHLIGIVLLGRQNRRIYDFLVMKFLMNKVCIVWRQLMKSMSRLGKV